MSQVRSHLWRNTLLSFIQELKTSREIAKAFSFTSVLRKNMMEKDKPGLYYALAKSSRKIDIDEIAERTQRSSTVNWMDVVCALRALQTETIDSFRKGEIVRLGNTGSFYVTLRSNDVLVQKDVKEELIKGAHVRLRPGKEIKDALKTLDFSKYKPENSEGNRTDPENPELKPDPDDGDEETPDPTV